MNETAKNRINKYDNLKGLAIILIVFANFIIAGDASLSVLKNFIFIFDLPIFFFVSGYFSKSSFDEINKSFKRLMIPYFILVIVLKIIYSIFNIEFKGVPFIVPQFGLWFLLSLFTMKLMLNITKKLKHPIMISIIMGLLIGFISCQVDYLSFARTFAYMPIFLIGYHYNDNKETIEKYLKSENLNVCLLLLFIIIAAMLAYFLPLDVIKFTVVYNTQINFALIDLLKRFAVMTTGIVLTLLLNKLMGNKQTILTKIGKNSMVIYISHIILYFPLTIMVPKIIQAYPILNNAMGYLLIAIIVTIIIVFIFSNDSISKHYNKMIDWIYELFFKSKDIWCMTYNAYSTGMKIIIPK